MKKIDIGHPPVVATCEGCKCFIYLGEPVVEFSDFELVHDDPDCWLRLLQNHHGTALFRLAEEGDVA